MTDQPKPVLIPVMPRYDEDGFPVCGGCPFYEEFDYVVLCKADGLAAGSVGTDCPIHNEAAREGMAAL